MIEKIIKAIAVLFLLWILIKAMGKPPGDIPGPELPPRLTGEDNEGAMMK